MYGRAAAAGCDEGRAARYLPGAAARIRTPPLDVVNDGWPPREEAERPPPVERGRGGEFLSAAHRLAGEAWRRRSAGVTLGAPFRGEGPGGEKGGRDERGSFGGRFPRAADALPLHGGSSSRPIKEGDGVRAGAGFRVSRFRGQGIRAFDTAPAAIRAYTVHERFASAIGQRYYA